MSHPPDYSRKLACVIVLKDGRLDIVPFELHSAA